MERMGLIFRKTIRLGPLRLNFTKHGFSSWSLQVLALVVELAHPGPPHRPARPRSWTSVAHGQSTGLPDLGRGGRRWRARDSSAAATRYIRSSAIVGAMICRPTGSPSDSPHGTEMAGPP